MDGEEQRAHDQVAMLDTQQPPPTQLAKTKRRRRFVVFLVVSLLNLALLALLASQLVTPSQGTSLSGATSPLIGRPAPDFTLPTLGATSASSIHLASLKGKPIILNFWASWCDACKQEARLFQQTWQHISKQGALLIGIDFEDTTAAGVRFLDHYGITYPNVVDTSSGSTAIAYGVTGVPETFFLDTHGTIIHKEIGALSAPLMQQDLRLLNLQSTSARDGDGSSFKIRGSFNEQTLADRRERRV